MVFIDTHTHIYAEEFDCDLDEMIQRAKENNLKHLFLPAIDSKYHDRMFRVVNSHPMLCHPMMGLHPTSVKENYLDELKIVSDYLATPGLKFSAIGEIGIDLYWDKTHEKEQCHAFDLQLGLAVTYDLPAVIHTRNSMDIAIAMVEAFDNPNLRGIFHCFSGNSAQAEELISLGFMLGIGGVVTYKNSGLQAVVEHIPLEHLVLETDAPWLTPVPYRGKRNEPAYIPLIAQKIAEIKNISLKEVAVVTTENALRMFGGIGEQVNR